MEYQDLGLAKDNVIIMGTALPDTAMVGDVFYNTSTFHTYQWDGTADDDYNVIFKLLILNTTSDTLSASDFKLHILVKRH